MKNNNSLRLVEEFLFPVCNDQKNCVNVLLEIPAFVSQDGRDI